MIKRLLVVAGLAVLAAGAYGFFSGRIASLHDPISQSVHVLKRDELPPLLGGNRAADSSRNTGVAVTLYMFDGNRLVTVTRTGRSKMPLPELAMRALLSGPTRDELNKGITTALPAPIELTSVTVDHGVADVDLNPAFETSSRDDLVRRVAQVVYTLSELDAVDSVRFFIDGQRLTVFDQDNQPHTDAVANARYSRFAPRCPLCQPAATSPLLIDVRGADEEAVP